GLRILEHVKVVPEQEVRDTKEDDQTSGRPTNPLQPRHAHQHEKARDRGDIVQLKRREEIDAQAEEQQSQRHPDKAELTYGYQKDNQRQVERRQKEETVVAHAVFETLQVAGNGLGTGVERKL